MTDRSVITIGNFDGVHRGHQAIVRRARVAAEAAGARVVALTFDPSPAAVLWADRVTPRLSTLGQRRAWLREAGADVVEVLEPTPQLLNLTPEAFVLQKLERFHPAAFVEGPDFRFGHKRAGDVHTLAAMGRTHGFDVHVVDHQEVELDDQTIAAVSSSLIRWLLGHGRVDDARRCLGRAHAVEGVVVEGEKRGRTIGFPTINLKTADGMMWPGDGVYAGHAALADGRILPAAISVGVKPTFGKRRRVLEAHLLGFDEDIYAQPVTLSFTRWIRDQYSFTGIEALKAQLARDVARVSARGEARPGEFDTIGRSTA